MVRPVVEVITDESAIREFIEQTCGCKKAIEGLCSLWIITIREMVQTLLLTHNVATGFSNALCYS